MSRTLVVALILAAGAVAAQEGAPPTMESLVKLYEDEERGIRYYERGEYDQAFEYFSRTAVRGLKKSQYLLAFMFFKGQHVDKSILLGMGWLGVACESGDPEWQSLYDGLYARATDAQQRMIDRKVALYIERYGSETQEVSCSRQPVTGSRRYEFRCVKTPGKVTPVFPLETQPE